MSLIYVSFKYVSQPVIIDIDDLSECSDGKVVEKESVESDHDRFKMSKDKGKGGKSRHVHPNADDGNKKTSGAENLTKSGSKVKASSNDSNPGSSSYQAQEVIRNLQGSPLSTGNGEMKGPLRSQKPEKVEVRLPTPFVHPDVEISPPAENYQLLKLPPTSAVQKPKKTRKDLLAMESVLAKNGLDNR
jgi:hypothetical protein